MFLRFIFAAVLNNSMCTLTSTLIMLYIVFIESGLIMCFVFPENSPRSSGKGGCRYEGAQTCLNATTKLPEFIFLSCVPWPRHNIVQHQNNWWIALQAICKSQPLGCNPPKGVDITSDGAGDVTAAVLLLDLTSCTLGIELSSF